MHSLPFRIALAFLLASLPNATRGQENLRNQPLPASESLADLLVEPGYQINLLAAEPLVIDPIDVAFDDRGRLWVVEMRDYPFPQSAANHGRIRILHDSNVDGTYDRSTTFADQLDMPTGLALWRDGVVVTVAGQMLFLRDTTGDDRADVTQQWLSGFSQQNEQLRANHPRLGMDGKWYIASGLRGGKVQLGKHFTQTSADDKDNDKQWNIGSRDIRFDQRTQQIELITGPAQFGLSFDRLGRRYFCSNRNPAIKAVFEQEDLNGNPLAGLISPAVDVMPAGTASRVFPRVDAWTTSNLHAGQFTAACGVFYREIANQQATDSAKEVFVCEPTGSLVTRQPLASGTYHEQPQTGGWSHENAWLSSTDAWFRPVNVTLAPDGEIVVVDMHRAVIEHPNWVPEELKNRPDERWGIEAGRIYWAGSIGAEPLSTMLQELGRRPLGEYSSKELAQSVGSPNRWLGETAFRILYERHLFNDLPDAIPQQLLEQSRNGTVAQLGRIRSLQTAALLSDNIHDQLPNLIARFDDSALLLTALRLLRSADPSVFDNQALLEALLEQLASDEPAVRFEALLAIGLVNDSKSKRVIQTVQELFSLGKLQPTNAFDATSLGSALRHSPEALLVAWLRALDSQTAAGTIAPAETIETIRQIAQSLSKSSSARTEALKVAAEIVVQFEASASDEKPAAPTMIAALTVLGSMKPALIPQEVWKTVRHLVASVNAPLPVRKTATGLLAKSHSDDDSKLIARLAKTESEPELSDALLAAWASSQDPECDQFLIEQLPSCSPSRRPLLLGFIASREARVKLLLGAFSDHVIEPKQVGVSGMKQLINSSRGTIKSQLQDQLSTIVAPDRTQVLNDYKDCLALPTDNLRGQALFAKHCASCHRIGDTGVHVGPDISDSRTKKPIELLTAILTPNLAIDNNYFRYVVLSTDGNVHEGMILDETQDTVTLRNEKNPRLTLRRSEIEEIRATGLSLMPDGLETQLDQQAMADLIAYIKNWRYLDGSVPVGN